MSYKALGRKIEGHYCVSRYMGDNEWDDTLAGKHGEIWYWGRGMYKALCVDDFGKEQIRTFKNQELTKVILKLEVPLDPRIQAKLANGRFKAA